MKRAVLAVVFVFSVILMSNYVSAYISTQERQEQSFYQKVWYGHHDYHDYYGRHEFGRHHFGHRRFWPWSFRPPYSGPRRWHRPLCPPGYWEWGYDQYGYPMRYWVEDPYCY